MLIVFYLIKLLFNSYLISHYYNILYNNLDVRIKLYLSYSSKYNNTIYKVFLDNNWKIFKVVISDIICYYIICYYK